MLIHSQTIIVQIKNIRIYKLKVNTYLLMILMILFEKSLLRWLCCDNPVWLWYPCLKCSGLSHIDKGVCWGPFIYGIIGKLGFVRNISQTQIHCSFETQKWNAGGRFWCVWAGHWTVWERGCWSLSPLFCWALVFVSVGMMHFLLCLGFM